MAQPNMISFDMPNAYTSQAREIQRRQQLADMMQQQASTPLEPNRMAGGYVVPVNPLEGLAKLMQGMQAKSERKGVDDLSAKLAAQMQKDRSDTLTRAMQAGQAVPAAAPQPGSEEAWGLGNQGVAADPKAMYQALMQSQDPMMQQAGMQGMLTSMQPKAPIKLGKDDRLVDPNTFKPVLEPTAQPKYHVVNGSLVPEPAAPGQTVQPAYTAPEKTPDAIRAVEVAMKNAGIDPQSPEARAFFRNMVTKQTTHQPAPSAVAVANAGPKAFESELGKQDAEKLAEWRKGAESGTQMLTTVANMRDAVKRGVFSGGGADLKTEAANLITGLTGAKIAALPGSQLFTAEASKLVLESIKMLGANPSNADREFIEKTVPRLGSSTEARDQLINYIEQKAHKQIDLFKRADSHARQNHGLGGFDYFPAQGAAPAASPGAVPAPPPGFTVVRP